MHCLLYCVAIWWGYSVCLLRFGSEIVASLHLIIKPSILCRRVTSIAILPIEHSGYWDPHGLCSTACLLVPPKQEPLHQHTPSHSQQPFFWNILNLPA